MKKKMLAVMMSAVLVGSLMAVPAFAAENLSDTSEGIAQFDGLEAKEAYDFQIVVKSFQSTYWQAALQGMDQAAEELGVTYSAQGPASESDIADQVNMLNSAINGAPAGVGLAACDTSSVLESLQAAADAGVPIVAFDTGIADAPEGSVVCTVVTDNTAAGEVAAVNLYEAVINACSIDSCQTVFYCAYLNTVFVEYCTSSGFCYIFGNSIYNRLSFQIGTLYFVTEIIGSRIKSYREVQTCV